MAKRSTIGENPLDAPVAENPLDTVLPGPGPAGRTARVEERLDLLEAGLAGLQAEAARVKGLGPEISREAVQLKTEMASLKGEVARLQAALPRARFVDIGRAAWELRLLKAPAEILLLRRAAQVADKSMAATVAVCKPGRSQRDAAAAAIASYIANGADPGPAGPITAGRGWDFMHRQPSEEPLAKGDIVHLELAPRVEGYSARIMRCAAVGGASPEQRATAERIRALQDEQIAAMHPGAAAREVDAILREPMLREGLRESFDNISGYTLGYYHPAGPHTSDFTRSFHPVADWRLEAGMVFHMYASAKGLSLSETVLVTQEGPRRLTQTPRTLFET
jgi:Xaa-Pro dipeptidase